MRDQPTAGWSERWRARRADTLARFGVQLPVVDWVSAEQRASRGFDEDELCLRLVQTFAAELEIMEVVVEDLTDEGAIVLLAGVSSDRADPRFVERRLDVGIEEDMLYYSGTWRFWIRSSQEVCNEPNAGRVWIPRWATRG